MTNESFSPSVDTIDIVQLRMHLAKAFSLGELKILCFDSSIPYDDIVGDTREEKCVELIQYCNRRGLLLSLIKECQKQRPHIQWVKAANTAGDSLVSNEQRAKHRSKLKKTRKDVHLVHTIRKSEIAGQAFDILIYLVRQQSDDLSIIDYAEFFLGRMWGNVIFSVQGSGGFLGITVSAYGPMLCTCRVVFIDGSEVILDRYIDFEMGSMLNDASARKD